jgi:hypothetical protein
MLQVQASARIISTDKHARLFWLTPAQADMTAHEEGPKASPDWMLGSCVSMVCGSKNFDSLTKCFKSGMGLKYDDYGHDMGCGVCRELAVWTRHHMLSHVARIPGAHV